MVISEHVQARVNKTLFLKFCYFPFLPLILFTMSDNFFAELDSEL